MRIPFVFFLSQAFWIKSQKTNHPIQEIWSDLQKKPCRFFFTGLGFSRHLEKSKKQEGKSKDQEEDLDDRREKIFFSFKSGPILPDTRMRLFRTKEETEISP